MNNTKTLVNILDKSIDELKEKREYFKNEKSDFTRKRKLNFEKIINLLMCMESGSLKDELYNYFDLNINNPTSSALIQQRNKIKPEAFEWLLNEFNNQTRKNTVYKGYRLLAIDGTSLLISFDKNDYNTYVPQGNQKEYNLFHINAMYDLLEHTYENIIIQNAIELNENGAFNNIIDNYKGEKAIYIADRGYESYNSFAHVIESNQKFLIRVKDINSKTSLTKSFNLETESDEFDLTVNKILTLKQTKDIKKDKYNYKFVPKNQTFDYLNESKDFYNIEFRVVRFKLNNDHYECIITNLSEEEFTVEEIKELYNKRWGIETSFRELKYAVGLNSFHSKRRDFIKQEIFLRILFYNFSERIIRIIKPRNNKKNRKYGYQVNFTRAFHIIKAYLKKIKSGCEPPNIESIIEKEIEPIRLGRSSPRKVRVQTFVYFIYR